METSPQYNVAYRRKLNDRRMGLELVCVCVCVCMTKLTLCAKMVKCLGFRLCSYRPQAAASPSRNHLPAAPRGAKVIALQRVPPSCTIRGQSHHTPIWAFWMQHLMPNISKHNMGSQLDHLKTHFNPVSTLQPSICV